MLNILFKECCKKCIFIDPQISSETEYNGVGDNQINTHIYCSHYNVCKKYTEEPEEKMLVKS